MTLLGRSSDQGRHRRCRHGKRIHVADSGTAATSTDAKVAEDHCQLRRPALLAIVYVTRQIGAANLIQDAELPSLELRRSGTSPIGNAEVRDSPGDRLPVRVEPGEHTRPSRTPTSTSLGGETITLYDAPGGVRGTVAWADQPGLLNGTGAAADAQHLEVGARRDGQPVPARRGATFPSRAACSPC